MKKIFLIILIISCTNSPRVTYEGQRNQEGKYHGDGTITFSDGRKYVGEFKDDKFNGQGTITFSDGRKYVGEFKDEKRNGQGTFSWSKGNKYVGEWKDDKFNGQGTYNWPNGETYVGGYKDDKRDGQGTFINANGTKWEGEFRGGIRYNGQGTFINANGTKWEGEVKDGKRNGQGTFTWSDGRKYVGEAKDGKWNGQGTFTRSDGSKYVGEWKDDKFNGQGTYTWADGKKYVGGFKDDKFNGQGTYNYVSGAKYVGEFKEGRLSGRGVYFGVDGKVLPGIYVNDQLEEKWTIEAVDNFLKNKYSHFKGLNYTQPATSKSLIKNDITVLPPPPEKPDFIAVVDFMGNNISEGECRALTDRLRIELYNTKYYKVVEREIMEEVLKEQKFQQSGCTSDACMVEIGQLMGVDRIVGGNISKVGNVYSVSARIVNVESGEIETIGVYDHIGNIGELLTDGMEKVAYELIK